MDELSHPESVERAAGRLAQLLSSPGGGLREAGGSGLVFEAELDIRPLERGSPPAGGTWAVDGGQALVADARCVQLYVTRWARVCWRPDGTATEEVGPLQAHLLGLGEDRRTLADLGAPVDPAAAVDVNLLRDWSEWSAVEESVGSAEPGALVLVDGDLQPDWRISSSWLAELFRVAAARDVVLAGVTKHTSLSWGGAPLLGVLEVVAADAAAGGPGPRSMWWAPVGRTRPDLEPGIQVAVARLDPDARFAFRVDLPGGVDAAEVLGRLSALCDDAAFPGYPYPLSSADRLAACPGWVRDETWSRIESLLDDAGIDPALRERAFADRHRLMERA